jgi:hypothetical protein
VSPGAVASFRFSTTELPETRHTPKLFWRFGSPEAEVQ